MACFDFDLLFKQCFLGDEKGCFSYDPQFDESSLPSISEISHSKNTVPQSTYKQFASSIEEFEPQSLLLTGRFGSTYLASHKSGCSVAIHTYHKATLDDTCQNHIPQREKQLLESITHPFVLHVLDALSDSNNLYLITATSRCIPLSNLLDFVSVNGGIQEKHITVFAACVVSVLQYCHSKNIIHRGIHPDSLLIDPSCSLKVADWGFAKIVTDRTYTLCGHVEYLSPEAICGETGYGRGVDYWALGVLIFEMLVGRSAFAPSEASHSLSQNSSHDSSTIDNILSSDPLFPSPFPHPAKSIIQSLCAKSISQRLGCTKGGKGIEDIASHIWFRQNGGIDWAKLEMGELPSLPQLPLEIFQASQERLSLDTLLTAPSYMGYFCHDWNDFKPSISKGSYTKNASSPDTIISMTHRRGISTSSVATTKQNHPPTPRSPDIFSLYPSHDSQVNPLRRPGH